MYETTVTVVGGLATTVTQVTFNDGGLKASFRHRQHGASVRPRPAAWVDGPQLFSSVRVLAQPRRERVVATLRVGDPVIVHGQARTREYEKDGQAHR